MLTQKSNADESYCSGLAESTERISRFLDEFAVKGLVLTIDIGTLREDDDKVTTTQ